ncbi:hypothetical protein FC54_GL000014 [Ligilactobacillus saerimneri DSM 16049]|nr:hypothetical protein FC54_GL000014 [Ligilactobacillus saerimneri DSM 16049]
MQSYLAMKNKQQVLNMLGLARRAQKLTTGEDRVLAAIRGRQTGLVFFASDGGASSRKKFTDKCQSYNVYLCTEFTRAELSYAIGSSRSLLAVMDQGFSTKMKQLLTTS